MGGAGGVMAAASKSSRILLLAPVLIAIALRRRTTSASLGKSIVDALPAFIIGYIALAFVRAAGDRLVAGPAWNQLLAANKLLVDVLMATVAAGIGLHLNVRSVLRSSARAVGVGAGASVWMAGLSVTMIALLSRGQVTTAVAVGAAALATSVVLHRTFAGRAARIRAIEGRFAAGDLLTLEESTVLLDQREAAGAIDDTFLRRLLDLLSPSIGELIPARTSPLGHGEGCRWLTYWEGKSGWALVAVVREPGSVTPIHAHPHRMLGKAIEGRLEELRFKDVAGGVELMSRAVLAHEELVEAEGLAALHVVRAIGDGAAIDIQLRGPEVGKPGRVLRPRTPVDVLAMDVGTTIEAIEEIDARPGQSGDGAAAGRPAPEAA
jgi:hypothetical protein